MSKKRNDKIRIYLYEMELNEEQEKYAELCAKARNIAYNHVVDCLRREYYAKVDSGKIHEYNDKQFDFNGLSKRMRTWRKTHPVMSRVPYWVMQGALQDAKGAYWNHKRRICGRPKLKDFKDPNLKQTFQLYKNPQDYSYIKKLNKKWGKTKIDNKFGHVKLELGPEWDNHRLKKLTIKKYRHSWYYVAVYETDKEKHHKGDGSVCGIDRNAKRAYAFHNGKFFDIPDKVEYLKEKIKAMQAKLERKVPGSGRHTKLKERIRDYYDKKTNLTRGFIEGMVHYATTHFDTISVEDINMKEIKETDWDGEKKQHKSKSKNKTNAQMADANHGYSVRRMDERAEVIKVPAEYTSQDCPVTDCGHRS